MTDVTVGGKPAPRKGLWSEAEDQLLRQAVENSSGGRWNQVAKRVPGRSAKSCRLRWCNQLRPTINKAPFSEWEAAVLAVGQESLGWKWADLARLLDNRTDNTVKNYWKCVISRNRSRIWKQNRYLSAKPDITLEELLEVRSSEAATDADVSPQARRVIVERELTHVAESDVFTHQSSAGHQKPAALPVSPDLKLFESTLPFPSSAVLDLAAAVQQHNATGRHRFNVKVEPFPCGRQEDQSDTSHSGPSEEQHQSGCNNPFFLDGACQQLSIRSSYSGCSSPGAVSMGYLSGGCSDTSSFMTNDILGLNSHIGPPDMEYLAKFFAPCL